MGDKKVIILILLISFIGFASAFSGLGSGTLSNPYNITNCTQLQEMRNNITAHYQLVNNIDCSDTINWNSGLGFQPVGNSSGSSYFNGSLNGNNNNISNLFINRSSSAHVGLFGWFSGKIINVGLIDINIIGGNFYVGGFVGETYNALNGGNITNCYVTGNITGNEQVGGITGVHCGNITNSYSRANVNGTNKIGGLVGYSYCGYIINSYSTGNVSGYDEIGGFVGHFALGTINKSYSTGNVNGNLSTGGFIGTLGGGMFPNADVQNSYSIGSVNGIDMVGGFIGEFDGWNSVRVNNSYSIGNVSGTNNVGGFVGYCYDGEINNSYSIGNVSGTNNVGGFAGDAESGLIKNSYWYNRSQGLDCYYGGNIGCTAISDLDYFYNYENKPMNLTAGTGWNFNSVWDDVYNGTNYPVLQWQGVELVFSGLGDGTIENPYNITTCLKLQEMKYNLTAHYQIVNNVDCSDTINWETGQGFMPVGRNLTAGFYFNGSLNGNNYNITDLFINRNSLDYVGLFGYVNYGNISNVKLVDVNISAKNYVGGVAGSFVGNMNNTYSTGTINGSSKVGGIAGYGNGIYYSHTSGSVKGGSYLGGIAGESGAINDSYSEGIVNGTGDYIGGVIGYSNSNYGNNLHSTGNVSGRDYIGGIAGYIYDVTLNNSYFTGNINGRNYVGGLVGGTMGFNTKVMNSYYSGNIDGNSSVGGIVGSLYNCEIHFCHASGNVNGNSSVGGIAGVAGGIMGPLVTINNSYSNINVISLENYAGGILGRYESELVTIENSYATGNINANNYTGGLVGYSGCYINNSYSTGNVSGVNYVGGFVGYHELGMINQSFSTGEVNGIGNYVGGLVGFGNYNLQINSSYSTGNVNGNEIVGGLAGSSGGIIDNSYATGNVNGTNYIGGLAGFISTTTDGGINNSYAIGNVSGSINVGGLVGFGSDTGIENCFSIGNVIGNNYVGGIVGQLYVAGFGNPHVTNSYWYNRSQSLNCFNFEYSIGNTGCIAISDLNYFYNYENAPMNLTSGDGWNFVDVWDDVLNRTNYPVLQFQQVIYIPIYPNISFVSLTTNSGEYAQTFITANVSVENASSIVNLTIFLYNSSSGNLILENITASNKLFWNITGLSLGNYSLNASVIDIAGLTNQTETLSINLSAPAEEPIVNPPSGGGGSTTQNQTQHNYQLGREFAEQGETFQLRKNNYIGFKHGEESHTMTLDRFDSRSARITIRSDPITVDLNKGELEEFDLDNDGEEDIEVLYNGIVDSEAQIFVKKFVVITGESEVFANSEGGEVKETEESGNTVVNTGNLGAGISVEKPKKERNALRTALISFIVMGMIIMILAMIGRNEKKKKDRYSSFFDN